VTSFQMAADNTVDCVFAPPPRAGQRPTTSEGLPHVQLNQHPPSEIIHQLTADCLAIPNVQCKESRMASADSRALCLPDELASGPPEAFIDGHEFCHLLPLPEGGAHVTLPEEIRRQAVALGWAEPHPISRIGEMPALVLLYAPRDRMELAIVLRMIRCSYEFACGLPSAAIRASCRP
jgi:hypothetical protein